MPTNQRHVTHNPTGGWDVRAPGADRSSGHFERKTDAEHRGREILGKDGGGELVIHDQNGRIIDSDTVPPGHDPFPPRDRR
jgi:Uncharacterized protein conserved in bacteria (DUF2188)